MSLSKESEAKILRTLVEETKDTKSFVLVINREGYTEVLSGGVGILAGSNMTPILTKAIRHLASSIDQQPERETVIDVAKPEKPEKSEKIMVPVWRVKFKGTEYLLLGKNEGSITTLEDYMNGNVGYAHLAATGNVIRSNEVIGKKSDIEYLEEIEAPTPNPGAAEKARNQLADLVAKALIESITKAKDDISRQ